MLQRTHQNMTTETLIADKREETKRPQGGVVPWTSHATTQEEGRQVGLVASQTPPIPLNSTRTDIFFQIRERGLLKAQSPMKSHPERGDKRRYYCFHREYRHDTEECRDL
ncbi:hypothetical protein B296_00056814 [Ensete ventricosum]|uniref:Uncharacterized protein n=1 Tax=Ensete ventricosum TaxID=4639 RepID=A0A426X248_ENSVE|nr:hypothetical protein B296_00056814 [Ensete ventricosum]